ncbi:MAG: 50S ribosomal protein L2 [Candidatus Moranbacteria bacterium]|nr:50S ribosomal protein L2 [Candidatus Moranbacteria bacterium]
MLVVKKIKNRGKRMLSYVYGENVDKKAKPYKPLTKSYKKRSGRMKSGRMSVRNRGGGAKKKLRIIDFKQKEGSYKILSVQKDPTRSAFIALVGDKEDKKYYFLATENMKKDMQIKVGEKVEIKEGNRTRINRIPTGTLICNIELYPGSGGIMARSAGAFAKIMGCEGGFAQLKIPSGEIRLVKETGYATIGQISNIQNNAIRIGKAGRNRLMGKKPHVRGKVMNPADHPHGGGEGNQPIGLKYPKTPWGKHALGVKTRKKKKASDKYILQRRKAKK